MRLNKNFLSFLCFFMFSFLIRAQPELLSTWKNKKLHDTIRLQALCDYAWNIRLKYVDSSIYYARKAIQLASEKNYEKWICDGRNTIGNAYWIVSKYDSAIVFFQKNLETARKKGDRLRMAKSFGNIGNIYLNRGIYSEAYKNYAMAERLAIELKDTMLIIASYNSIALIFKYQKEYEKQLAYDNKSLELGMKIKDDYSIAISYGNIGGVYADLDQHEKAIACFEKSLKFFAETDAYDLLASLYNNLGSSYISLKDYSMARSFLQKGIDLKLAMENKHGITLSYVNMGSLEKDLGNYKAAKKWCEKAYEEATEIKTPVLLQNACRCLYEAESKLNNYKSALVWLEKYLLYKDSVYNQESRKEFERREIEFEYTLKSASDSVRNAEKQKVKDAKILAQNTLLQKNKQRMYFLIAGSLLLFVFVVFILNRFRVTRNQKAVIELKKSEVEQKNKEITDSINYALRIQSAILPPHNLITQYFPSSFIYYKPKDIVAGDFYFFEKVNNGFVFAVADCTGHGVPGALVSVMCANALTKVVHDKKVNNPANVLDEVCIELDRQFANSTEAVYDGMDIALCYYIPPTGELQFAGANNGLLLVKNGELSYISPNKQPVGKFANRVPFTNHDLVINKGDRIYLFTDGYTDQFGGENALTTGGKKFKFSNFKKLIQSGETLSAAEMKSTLDTRMVEWMGQVEQIDDITVMGIHF